MHADEEHRRHSDIRRRAEAAGAVRRGMRRLSEAFIRRARRLSTPLCSLAGVLPSTSPTRQRGPGVRRMVGAAAPNAAPSTVRDGVKALAPAASLRRLRVGCCI